MKTTPSDPAWALFPATRDDASYATEAQYVEFGDATRDELYAAVAGDPAARPAEKVPQLHYALRHWLDHTSTIWGRGRLRSMLEAMDARARNVEADFWRIVAYQREIQRDIRSDYYSLTINPAPSPGRQRWSPLRR